MWEIPAAAGNFTRRFRRLARQSVSKIAGRAAGRLHETTIERRRR